MTELSKAKQMLDSGILATVHSDDPAYFGGYINANLIAVADGLGLTAAEIIQLARNSFTASFLSPADQATHIAAVDQIAVSA